MRSGWMHVAGFEGQEKFAPKTLAEEVYVDENKNILSLIAENTVKEDDVLNILKSAKGRKILSEAQGGISYKKITIPSSSYDEQNLYTTKVLDTGNIFWIDEKSQVYSIERQGNYITIFSNTSLENKTLNILSIKNSDMLVFVGLVQKTSNKTLYFNKENIDMWQIWKYQNAKIDALDDRVKITALDKAYCETQFILKEPIDLSVYKTLRLYAKTQKVYDDYGSQYEAKFGVFKNDIDITVQQRTNFLCQANAINIVDYRDLDISTVNGFYRIGTSDKMQGEIYKMELIR